MAINVNGTQYWTKVLQLLGSDVKHGSWFGYHNGKYCKFLLPIKRDHILKEMG